MSIKSRLKKIERFFLSRKVAIALLILTLIPLVISTRLDQIGAVVSSPLFLLLPIFIFISVFLCTLNRLKVERGRQPKDASFKFKTTLSVEGGCDQDRIFSTLRSKSWMEFRRDEEETIFRKGGIGFWGSMVFHLGLLMILLSGTVTSATLFNAEILVTEGRPQAMGKEGLLNISREPILPVSYPSGMMDLVAFRAEYDDDGFPVDYVASLNLINENEEISHDVRVNSPLKIDGIQYTMDFYGFAPGFIITNTAGELLFDGYVALRLLDEEEDFFRIPETDMVVYVRMFPDYFDNEGQPDTRSRIPNNPVYGLKLKQLTAIKAGPGKLLKRGKSVNLKDLNIKVEDYKYWVHFGLSRDMGQPLLFLSVILIVAGLSVRFINYEKWLKVRLVRAGSDRLDMEIAGYTKHFPALFEEEVVNIADRLRKGL